jgi:hypothetical protein
MRIIISIILSISFYTIDCQNIIHENILLNKGRFYLYWGWNFDAYTPSNIHFTGTNYDFILEKVRAVDRQSKFRAGLYLNPATMTIPQYNLRIGYFLSDKYNISFGADHMKYVASQNQTVKIDGFIDLPGNEYSGQYDHKEISIKKEFLEFEHTDGLNYVNMDFRRQDCILQTSHFSLHVTEGIGLGFLVPRTDATLLHFERHDKFHIAGYGTSLMVGLQIKFKNHFFIQSEAKAGYINMTDILTTSSAADRASQHFFFQQANIVFGSYFGF